MKNEQQRPELGIRVMLVDDDPAIRKLVGAYLEKEGYRTQIFEKAEDCLAAFIKSPAEIVITDLNLPKKSGMDLLAEIKKLNVSTEVIIISGAADKDAAIQALREGAFDLLEKPISVRMISECIRRTVRYQDAVRKCEHLGRQVEMLSSSIGERWRIEGFIGHSEAANNVIEQVRVLQKSDRIPVLIRGESGTGKELVAHAIHYGSSRAHYPIVPINCSAVPDDLAESIFFGHVKGAFTGATTDHKGCFESADGGTLFLDEIGDMPATQQIKLLRVLEDGTFTPVGASKGRKVDVRIVAATNSDLEQKVKGGVFREDLYYRIAHFTIKMPPLRERKDDIPQLVEHFVKRISGEMGIARPVISKEFMDVICGREFRGNVRELKNTIELAIILCEGSELTREHLRDVAGPGIGTGGRVEEIPENLKEAEAVLIRRSIERVGGNISEAARRLGITRAKIYRYK